MSRAMTAKMTLVEPSRSAEIERLPARAKIGDRFHRIAGIDDHQICVVLVRGEAPEPGERERVESCIGIARERQLRQCTAHDENRSAVALAGVAEPIEACEAGSARLVLYDDDGMARYVTAEVTSHQPSRHVVVAA